MPRSCIADAISKQGANQAALLHHRLPQAGLIWSAAPAPTASLPLAGGDIVIAPAFAAGYGLCPQAASTPLILQPGFPAPAVPGRRCAAAGSNHQFLCWTLSSQARPSACSVRWQTGAGTGGTFPAGGLKHVRTLRWLPGRLLNWTASNWRTLLPRDQAADLHCPLTGVTPRDYNRQDDWWASAWSIPPIVQSTRTPLGYRIDHPGAPPPTVSAFRPLKRLPNPLLHLGIRLDRTPLGIRRGATWLGQLMGPRRGVDFGRQHQYDTALRLHARDEQRSHDRRLHCPI